MLLFEDILRLEMDFLKKKLITEDLKKELGSNFYRKKINNKVFNSLLKRYDEYVFEKGFTFKEQFLLTKQVIMILKSKKEDLVNYKSLIKKKDQLIKTNAKYGNYAGLYPSPEIQLGWIEEILKNSK